MFKVNEYFGGRVKSLSFTSSDGPATIGVMDIGEYEFGTSTVEYMTVTSGELNVKLPDQNDWRVFKKGETFIVDKDKKFQLILKEESSYICIYK